MGFPAASQDASAPKNLRADRLEAKNSIAINLFAVGEEVEERTRSSKLKKEQGDTLLYWVNQKMLYAPYIPEFHCREERGMHSC